MEKKKSIRDCYEKIRQREISELMEAAENAGGSVEFDEEDAPIVIANVNGYFTHPADFRIVRVRIKDGELLIDGRERGYSGCADWFEDEAPMEIGDIIYGQISFITDMIKAGNFLPTYDMETMLCSDGSWCDIDTDNGMWEYQSDANDDDTYMSGNFFTEDDDDSVVYDYDGCYELPKGVKAALLECGYRLDI